MHELITSDEFQRYFKKQLSMMAKFIWSRMKASQYQEAKGALDLARRVYKFPTELSNGDDIEQFIEGVIREFEVEFVKSGLGE